MSEKPDKLTPIAKIKYEELIRVLEEDVRVKTQDFGAAINFGDGDGWHDETVALLERAKLDAQGALFKAEQINKSSEILAEPTQFESVQLGHKICVNLLDDPEVTRPCYVTILPSANLAVLDKLFDNTANLLVSDRSPLGQALLGKKVGDEAIYNSSRAIIVKILSSDVF